MEKRIVLKASDGTLLVGTAEFYAVAEGDAATVLAGWAVPDGPATNAELNGSVVVAVEVA